MITVSTRERLSKAITEILSQGKIVQARDNLFYVPSSHADHKPYLVNLSGTHSCTCDDFFYRGAVDGTECKHILAAMIDAVNHTAILLNW